MQSNWATDCRRQHNSEIFCKRLGVIHKWFPQKHSKNRPLPLSALGHTPLPSVRTCSMDDQPVAGVGACLCCRLERDRVFGVQYTDYRPDVHHQPASADWLHAAVQRLYQHRHHRRSVTSQVTSSSLPHPSTAQELHVANKNCTFSEITRYFIIYVFIRSRKAQRDTKKTQQ